MKRELYKAYFALALVSFFWGTTYIASRIGAQHMPGLFVSGLRQFISGLILVGFFLLKGNRLPDLATLKRISIHSIFLICFANGLLTWSLEYISGGLAAIIAALIPLFIVLFSIGMSKCARITRSMMAGLLIGFAGVATIFYDYFADLGNRSFLFGIVLAFLSILSWSFGTVYAARERPPIDILFNVGLQMLIAGILILVTCGLTGKYINPTHIDSYSWLAILYLVLFGSIIAYSAYVFVIGKLPATQVSIYAYINPIVAVVFGWLLLSEKMSGSMIMGTLITLAGVYIVSRETKKVKL